MGSVLTSTSAAGSLKTELRRSTVLIGFTSHRSYSCFFFFFCKIYGGECSLIDCGSRMSSARPVDDDSDEVYPCKFCPRVLLTHGALTIHQYSCKGMKREIGSILSDLAEIYSSQKRPRVEVEASDSSEPPMFASTADPSTSTPSSIAAHPIFTSPSNSCDNSATSMSPTSPAPMSIVPTSTSTTPAAVSISISIPTAASTSTSILTSNLASHTHSNSAIQPFSAVLRPEHVEDDEVFEDNTPPVQTGESSPRYKLRSRAVPSVPRRPRDMLPQAPSAPSAPVRTPPSRESESESPGSALRPNADSGHGSVDSSSNACTVPNVFKLLRQYCSPTFPTHDPDEKAHLLSLLRDHDHAVNPTMPVTGAPPSYHPYPNWSSYRLGSWYWSSSGLSSSSFEELLDILLDSRFNLTDLQNVNWKRINKKLAAGESPTISQSPEDDELADTWQESPITISVPLHKKTADPRTFCEYPAASLWHRKILSALRTKLKDPVGFANFHMEPYQLLWQGILGRTIRVHGEAFTSPAFIKAHEELQRSPREPQCQLQRVVVALMFASDATLLTDFGHEKLWPLYLAFGNESKYRRSQTSCRAFQHIAYFQSVCTYVPEQLPYVY